MHEARLQAGKFLAQEHPVEADVVIGAPDSGLDAALGYAQESGIPYGIGFIKNKLRGPHLHPGQPGPARKQRAHQAQRHPLDGGGQTRRAGGRLHRARHHQRPAPSACCARPRARKCTTASARRRSSTPANSGTDIPDEKQLIATGHTVEEINKLVGSDTLGYLSVEHVRQLAIHSHCGFCDGCFTGQYPVDPPSKTMDIVYDKPLSISNPSKKL